MIRAVACGRCGAPAGEPCRSASGRELSGVHKVRARASLARRRVARELFVEEALGIAEELTGTLIEKELERDGAAADRRAVAARDARMRRGDAGAVSALEKAARVWGRR